jgi:2-methylisocitrate lyase-like PEP mutase family enzyme
VALSQREKGEVFRALHEGEPFVFPNPWDAGSAKILAGLGFKALATTSSGFAFSLGRADGNVTLDEVATHIESLNGATDLPVAADLENGYGRTPEDAARAITVAAGAGAVGGSIEDYDRDEDRIYELDHAVERVAAGAEAARALDFPFTYTARAENHIHGLDEIEDTITRLQAYEKAGADVLFAPGLRSTEQIRAVCEAVSKPVNVLLFGALGLSFAEVTGAGAQRISIGGSLTFTAANAAIEAAEKVLQGDFSGLQGPDQRVKYWLQP